MYAKPKSKEVEFFLQKKKNKKGPSLGFTFEVRKMKNQEKLKVARKKVSK